MRYQLLVVIVLSAFSTIDVLGQGRFDNVEIKTTHVGGNVHMLEGAGGNIGVSVGDDGVLMIDDQFAPLAPKIRAALSKLGGDKVRYLLNTHHHGDHVGGNAEFGKEATIIAHANVRKRLSSSSNQGGRARSSTPKEGLPVVTFERAISVHFNGEEIKVMHLPRGHTDGDSVVLFTKSKVVHMGDHFFNGRFPFVDLRSGGSVQGYVDNVGKIISELPEDVKIIPGHGSLATLEDLEKFHAMLKETTTLVRERMAAGKSLEDIQKEGLPAKWDSWGKGFIPTGRWIETIHRSYTTKE